MAKKGAGVTDYSSSAGRPTNYSVIPLLCLRTLHRQGFSIYTVADYSALISATLDSCGRAKYASLPKAGWVQEVLAAHNYFFRYGYHMLIHCADP